MLGPGPNQTKGVMKGDDTDHGEGAGPSLGSQSAAVERLHNAPHDEAVALVAEAEDSEDESVPAVPAALH
jgi:hypothetical protein